MNTVTGQHRIVFALREHGQDVEREVGDELVALINHAVLRMKALVPNGANSTLVDSICAETLDAMTVQAGPNTNYARPVEEGIKPGGKGLPRYMGGKDGATVAWLKAMPDRGGVKFNRDHVKSRRKGSKVFNAAMDSLRNRYYGLAKHIREQGTKAHPFVEPVAIEMQSLALTRLGEAVRKTLAARPAGGAAA